MTTDRLFIEKFPWLPSLNKIDELSSMNPIDYIKNSYKINNPNVINNLILDFFYKTFENIEIYPKYEEIKKINFTTQFYFIIKFLIYILDNKIILHRIANSYSKTIRKEIKENDFWLIQTILNDLEIKNEFYQKPKIYKTTFRGIDPITKEAYFGLYYTHYLKLASYLFDNQSKLINNALLNGFIHIENKRIIRLIQEYIRYKITDWKLTDRDLFRKNLLNIDEFKDLYDKIQKIWKSNKETFEYAQINFKNVENVSNYFPPCIIEIFSKLDNGQNLLHSERLYFVFFLLALEYSVEQIIEIFSILPDFNLEKTKYQIEFAKKKGYFPHSCNTLKSLNLCMAKKYKDKICLDGYFSKTLDKQKNIKHPLFYIQVKKYRTSKRGENENSNQNNKKLGEK